jgi:hypothetical protein
VQNSLLLHKLNSLDVTTKFIIIAMFLNVKRCWLGNLKEGDSLEDLARKKILKLVFNRKEGSRVDSSG